MLCRYCGAEVCTNWVLGPLKGVHLCTIAPTLFHSHCRASVTAVHAGSQPEMLKPKPHSLNSEPKQPKP